MNKCKKTVALLLAAMIMVMVAACGGETASSMSSAPVASISGTSMPQQFEPEAEVLNQAFLTGLEKDADYPEGKRITAVMLNNVPSARPQNGISEAEILVEIKVEYDVTRFMAIYDDYETMPTTGGIRSARDQFFQLLIPYWGFYVHEGPAGSHPVNWMMDDYDYHEFDLQSNYYSVRETDPSRGTDSYSWYNTNAALITEHIENRELDDYRSYSSPIFHFLPFDEEPRVPEEGMVDMVEVPHAPPYYMSYFDYDDAAGAYSMSMHNSSSGQREPTIDNNNGEQLDFDNVILLFAPFDVYPNTTENLPRVDYSNGGAGYYFTQGGYELIYWRKGPANSPLQLLKGDKSEELLEVNTGTTYLAVVDDVELPDFYDALTSGAMGTQGGSVSSEPEDID